MKSVVTKRKENTMGYKDEEIMAEKKAAALKKIQELEGKKLEAQLKESIYDECIHVDDKEIRFSRRTFADLGISIYMPETFEQMEEEVKEALYPLKSAPKYVFVDYEIPFQITLNQTKHKVPDEGMSRFMDISSKIIENQGPKAKVLGKGVVRIKEHNVGILEVATRAIDGNVHNVMFNISINGQIVMGNIHFPAPYVKRLAVVAKEMMDSIEFIEDAKQSGDMSS